MAKRLKHCPLCNKIPQIVTHEHDHIISYTIDCPCSFAYLKKNSHDTKESAIAEWNNLVNDYITNKETKRKAWESMDLKSEIKHALEIIQLNCDMQHTVYGNCSNCPVNTDDNCDYDYTCLFHDYCVPCAWDISELIKKGNLNGNT